MIHYDRLIIYTLAISAVLFLIHKICTHPHKNKDGDNNDDINKSD